jgi:hypothetical protein
MSWFGGGPPEPRGPSRVEVSIRFHVLVLSKNRKLKKHCCMLDRSACSNLLLTCTDDVLLKL